MKHALGRSVHCEAEIVFWEFCPERIVSAEAVLEESLHFWIICLSPTQAVSSGDMFYACAREAIHGDGLWARLNPCRTDVSLGP